MISAPRLSCFSACNIEKLGRACYIVPVLQMVKPIVDDLLVLKKGVSMYDAHLQDVLAFMGDNPRASEVVGHMTGYPNK